MLPETSIFFVYTLYIYEENGKMGYQVIMRKGRSNHSLGGGGGAWGRGNTRELYGSILPISIRGHEDVEYL